MTRYFFVDYENVNRDGLNGITRLTEKDCVRIYYSKSAETLTFGLHRRINTSRAHFDYIKVQVPIKNAVDCQILFDIRDMAKENRDAEYVIVSNDKDFDKAIEEFKGHNLNVKKVLEICRQDEPAKKEETKKESAKKEPSKKEPAKKESSGKESGKKETAKKEPSKKEAVKKEAAKKKSTKKEPEKEGQKKEPAKKKSAKKEPAQKEPEKIEAAKEAPVEKAADKASAGKASGAKTPRAKASRIKTLGTQPFADKTKTREEQVRTFFGQHFKKKIYKDHKDEIIQAVVKGTTKQQVNNNLMQIYNSETVSEIYKKIQPLIKELPGK